MQEQDSEIHLLPCSIEYNGPAPVSGFFQIESMLEDKASGSLASEHSKNKKILKSHYRGRMLKGELVELPCAVDGIHAMQKINGAIGDSCTEPVKWEIAGTFKAIHVWEHDHDPDTEMFEDCFRWFDIARSVSINFELIHC